MQNYPNERSGRHAPRPPQLQFPSLPHSRVRSPDTHVGVNVGLLGPIQDPQPYEPEEQSPGADSYETGGYASQSSTNYPAEKPRRMPRSDYQAHGSWPSTNYVLGMAPEINVLQNEEYPGSFESTLPQQVYHMVATSIPGLRDARDHSNSQAPEVGFNTTGHTGRNAQHAPSGTGRRSSVGSHPRLQTSYQEMMQIPSDSEPSAIHMSVSNQQFDQPEAIITGYRDPSLVLLGQPSGNGRTFTTTPSPINSNVSEPLHNSQTFYQSVPQYPRGPPFQRQNQGARRGTNYPLFGQDPFMMPDIMPSSDSQGLARNAHKPPPEDTKALLSPNWQSSQQTSSNSEHGKRSNLSDNDSRQPQRKKTRKSKRKRCADSSSPTPPPTTAKRAKRRRYNSKERAEVKEKRRTGACKACHIAKRKARESLPISFSRCHQADCSCSARIHHLGMALPCDISLCRENPPPDRPLPGLPPAGLKNERCKPINGIAFSMVDTGVEEAQ